MPSPQLTKLQPEARPRRASLFSTRGLLLLALPLLLACQFQMESVTVSRAEYSKLGAAPSPIPDVIRFEGEERHFFGEPIRWTLMTATVLDPDERCMARGAKVARSELKGAIWQSFGRRDDPDSPAHPTSFKIDLETQSLVIDGKTYDLERNDRFRLQFDEQCRPTVTPE